MSRHAFARSMVAILAAFLGVLSTSVEAQPKPGSVDQERPAGPKDESDAGSVNLDRDRDGGGNGEAPGPIDLAGSRIAYAVRGGLLGVDNLLLVDDDGSVFYRASSLAIDSENFEISDTISPNHVRTLKQLVKEVGFASMPDRFDGDGIVIDGVDLGIAVRLAAATEKTVWSHSAAREDQGFTRLRNTLDALVAELRSREILKLKSYSDDGSGKVREFRLLSDGRFRIEIQADGQPLTWGEGRLSAAERSELAASIGKFDFAGSRLCRSESGTGEEHELFLSLAGTPRAVQFRGDDAAGELAPLLEIARMAKHAAEEAGL